MPVSLTRLAIWRVAILHLASIKPAVKVLKRRFVSLVGAVERPMETHTASSVIISYTETKGQGLSIYSGDGRGEFTIRVHTFCLVIGSRLVWLGGRYG